MNNKELVAYARDYAYQEGGMNLIVIHQLCRRLEDSESLTDALLLDQAYQVDRKWYHSLMWWKK